MAINNHKVDIKAFRQKNRLKQADIAKYLEVSSSFISLIETGRTPLPEKHYQKIIENKNWDTSDLIPLEERLKELNSMEQLKVEIKRLKSSIENIEKILGIKL